MKSSGKLPAKSAAKLKSKPDPQGFEAAARVLAAGGRVPKKFAKARPASAGPTLAAQQSQAKLSPARRVAFEILTLVGQGKGHSDELLLGARLDDLSEPDRHLATALVMGVLRWQIALDARLKTLLERPEQRLAEPVSIALRLGAFQLLHMDRIPAHAALSEAVELCRAAGQPHAAGMVNAVLRKLAAQRACLPATPIFERTAAFAERLGHPLWLVERWAANYGRDGALAICEADQSEPESSRRADARLFSPDLSAPDLSPAELNPAKVQIDDGSRLVAELAAAALPHIKGRAARVWDCCAAPGGKTLVLAARLVERHAEILATDISAKRLSHMQARFRRYPAAVAIKTAVADATALPGEAGLFDLILCDVPCSGTGTLGRNPEIRLRLEVSELARQAVRQRAILNAALARLAPGGRLVYSTCSLEPEENEQIVAAVAEGFRRISVSSLIQSIPGFANLREGAAVSGALRTLPGLDPCDGFYTAVLER